MNSLKRKYLNGTCEIVSTATGNGTIRNDDSYVISDGYVHAVTLKGEFLGNYGTLGCALRAAKGTECDRCREQGERDAGDTEGNDVIIAGKLTAVTDPAEKQSRKKAPRKKRTE